MEAYTICQSCGMPMDRVELMGSESDLSKSTIYCSACYQHGAFTHPEMTKQKMKDYVRKMLKKDNVEEDLINLCVERVSFLSRWLGIPAIHHTVNGIEGSSSDVYTLIGAEIFLIKK